MRGTPESATKKSPAWKKRDLIKRKVRRSSSNRNLNATFSNSPSSSATTLSAAESRHPLDDVLFPPVTVAPSKNPFKRSPRKRLSPQKKRRRVESNAAAVAPISAPPPDWDDETANDPFSTSTPKPLSIATTMLRRPSSFIRSNSLDTTSLLEQYPIDFSGYVDEEKSLSRFSSGLSRCNSNVQLAPKEDAGKISRCMPLDVRLGTRLRLTSPVPFPWMPTTSAPAVGVHHVRLSGKELHDGVAHANSVAIDNMHLPAIPVDDNDSSASAATTTLLAAGLLFYQYPSIAGMSLFPRLSSQLKNHNKEMGESSASLATPLISAALCPQLVDALNIEWCDSMEYLYLSWKKSERHSFYVCCPSFTALFTRRKETKQASGEAGEASQTCFHVSDSGLKHVVLITPTTSGFRRYLRENGVTVEVVSAKKARNSGGGAGGLALRRLTSDNEMSWAGSSCSGTIDEIEGSTLSGFMFDELDKENSCTGSAEHPATPEKAEKENGEEKKEDGDGSESEEGASPTKETEAAAWLKTIGVSPSTTLGLRKFHSSTARLSSGSNGSGGGRKGGAAAVGNCTVIVKETSSVQAFFNILMTSTRATRAIAGIHASLPPSLLAAQPFIHSQLSQLKRNSQCVRRVGRGGAFDYVLELEGGPIMPNTVSLVAQFARRLMTSSEKSPSTSSATLRVNDRVAYAGLNSLLEDSVDWTEITVNQEGQFAWK